MPDIVFVFGELIRNSLYHVILRLVLNGFNAVIELRLKSENLFFYYISYFNGKKLERCQ